MRLIAGLALATLCAGAAMAADMTTKAPSASPVFSGYPYGTTGFYWGLNTIGGGGAVSASGPGVNPNSVVSNQVGVGLTAGYAWGSTSSPVFYAIEAMFDVQNINGTAPGFSLDGPAAFEQRFKIGTPLANFLSLFPSNLGLPAVPPFPTLPNGTVASNMQPYLMAGLHEDDVSANFGVASNRAWRVAPSVGIGTMAQLTKGVAIDVWAETIFPSKSVCFGLPTGAACSSIGQQVKAGLAVLY